MIDTELSFARVDVKAPARAKRLPPLLGLGFAAVVSVGLWGALALTVARVL